MHNFASDTQTLPSRAMREAVLDAPLADEQGAAGDPTTNALCERVADLLGKEAAVFMPSGTMCNQIAIAVHCRPGDEVICEAGCHILNYEQAGHAQLSGLAILPIVVHATDEREYLQSGLADMLASRIGQQPGLAAVRIDDPEKATTDREAAREAGRTAGAQWVLFGSFTRFGEGASLDVQCVPVAGEHPPEGHRSVFVQAGTLGEIIPRLDSLAQRVAHHVTAGRSTLPSGAGAAGAADPAGELGDALSELDALRHRVEVLEQRIFPADEVGSTAAR